MQSLAIELPLPRKEVHQNARVDRHAYAEAKAADRLDGKHCALKALERPLGRKLYRLAPPGWARCTAELAFRFPDRRGRDLFNYAAACKHLMDGVVDAGIILDDRCTVLGHIDGISWSVDKRNVGVTLTIKEAG